MARIGSVLVVSSQPRYIDEARRIYGLVERKRRLTVRSWHVYYLQNSRSNDTAYVLQQAFTPNNVTATPTPASGGAPNSIPPSGPAVRRRLGCWRAGRQRVAGQRLPAATALAAASARAELVGSAAGWAARVAAGAQPAASRRRRPGRPRVRQPAARRAGRGGRSGRRRSANADAMRIIPNAQNNALLVYATPQENDTVETMFRKLDILPLQVRIDATIAEVTLNDSLNYGTQFFFKAGLQGALSFANPVSPASAVAGAFPGFANGFPGFVLSGPNSTSAALSLLQSVTTVKVLSSPQLLVLDNESARLQVGALVPYLSQTSQSTHHHRVAGDQLDQLPADRRHHAGDAAGEQRRAGDAGHRAGGERRGQPLSPPPG